MDWFPLLNSLRIAALSAVIIFFAGIFAARLLSEAHPLLKGILDVIFTLPLVLPPTVVGYLLLRIIGPRMPIGSFLQQVFGLRLTMTWGASVLAVCIVIFPLMYRTARGAFESYDTTLTQAALTMGHSRAWAFWRIQLPVCRQSLMAGAVLAFARALGEYGATSMVSGYTPGKTATISTTVYQLWRLGDDALAFRWVLVNTALSAVVLVAMSLLERRRSV